jgi:hypothetical protein
MEMAYRNRPQDPVLSPIERVRREARKDLAPEELEAFKSACQARKERRFYTLAEHQAVEKHRRSLDAAARRLQLPSYAAALHRSFQKSPGVEADDAITAEIVRLLEWSRRNAAHVERLTAEFEKGIHENL